MLNENLDRCPVATAVREAVIFLSVLGIPLSERQCDILREAVTSALREHDPVELIAPSGDLIDLGNGMRLDERGDVFYSAAWLERREEQAAPLSAALERADDMLGEDAA